MPHSSRFRGLFARIAFLVACVLFAQVNKSAATELSEVKPGAPLDIVFVIDISGSTGGILASVRGKFWEIQNEISRLSPTPNYRLGIVCMGRPSFKKENNYVSIITDLTENIDAAASPFFQIKDVTGPGNYFMGHALDVAVNELSWSSDPDAIKLMFVAGNGKASAGPGFKKPVQNAKEKGIVMHSLYFLTYNNAEEQADWNTMATATGGSFTAIGLKESAVVLDKPYDGSLLREASQMINTSYIYYGPNGLARYEMQADLDEEAELQGENQVEARTFFKATKLYQGKNASWDVIDYKNAGGDIMKISMKQVDESLAAMSDDEFMMHVAEIGYDRMEYISIIKMLSTHREEFLREKREKLENYRFGKTFFGVVNKIIVETAEAKGYQLDY